MQTSETVFDTNSLLRLHAALTGIKRLQGISSESKKPRTREILIDIISNLSRYCRQSYTCSLLKAVITTAYFRFLRLMSFLLNMFYDSNVKASLTFKCMTQHLFADFSYSIALDTYL